MKVPLQVTDKFHSRMNVHHIHVNVTLVCESLPNSHALYMYVTFEAVLSNVISDLNR